MTDLDTLLYIQGELADIQRDLARLSLMALHGTEGNAGLRGGIVVGLERVLARLKPQIPPVVAVPHLAPADVVAVEGAGAQAVVWLAVQDNPDGKPTARLIGPGPFSQP
jgi:hypothetical protein